MIEVKRLGPADAQIYQEIRLEALARHPDAFGSSYEEAVRDHAETIASSLERLAVFGAFDSGTLVGKVGFSVRAHDKLSHKGAIFGMYVKEGARRRGIGSRLLDAVLDYARRHVEAVQLTVVTTNTPAVAFYERHGFVQYGLERRAIKLGESYIDEALMEKPLG